jgi:hypothetical protein
VGVCVCVSRVQGLGRHHLHNVSDRSPIHIHGMGFGAATIGLGVVARRAHMRQTAALSSANNGAIHAAIGESGGEVMEHSSTRYLLSPNTSLRAVICYQSLSVSHAAAMQRPWHATRLGAASASRCLPAMHLHGTNTGDAQRHGASMTSMTPSASPTGCHCATFCMPSHVPRSFGRSRALCLRTSQGERSSGQASRVRHPPRLLVMKRCGDSAPNSVI